MRRSTRLYGRASLLLGVSLLFPQYCPAQNAQDHEVKKALDAIRSQELGVKNMSVQANTKSKLWDPVRKQLVSNGESDVTEIFGDVPHGLARLEAHRMLSPQQNGPEPFFFRVFTATYDGRIGEMYRTKAGPPSEPRKVSDATVYGTRPPELEIDYVGRTATIFGYTEQRDFDHSRFSEYLERPDATLKGETVMDNGHTYFRLTRVGEKYPNPGKQEFWLDPTRNFSIAKIIDYRGVFTAPNKLSFSDSTDARSITSVTDFWEPAPGIFYPKHVSSEYYGPQAGPARVFFSSAIDVVSASFNDPTVDQKTFRVTLPQGTLVNDATSGKTFVIGGTPEQQKKQIDDAVEEAVRKLENPSVAAPTTVPQ